MSNSVYQSTVSVKTRQELELQVQCLNAENKRLKERNVLQKIELVLRDHARTQLQHDYDDMMNMFGDPWRG